MCKYNEADLPLPPKVDAAQFPFAVVIRNGGTYELDFFSAPFVESDVVEGESTVAGFAPRPVDSYPTYQNYVFELSGDAWVPAALEANPLTVTNSADSVWFRNSGENRLLWANYNIYDTKGNLFLAGSPAILEVQGNSRRLSLYLGYLAGKMFAGMQKDVADGRLEINGLAVVFNPTTAEATFGESGSIVANGSQFYIGSYPVYYDNGHLIVEDT